MGFVKAMDKLPWVLKLILSLPGLDIVWAIYRIVKGAAKKKTAILIAGILWIIPGAVICWLVDIISCIVSKKPAILA